MDGRYFLFPSSLLVVDKNKLKLTDQYEVLMCKQSKGLTCLHQEILMKSVIQNEPAGCLQGT